MIRVSSHVEPSAGTGFPFYLHRVARLPTAGLPFPYDVRIFLVGIFRVSPLLLCDSHTRIFLSHHSLPFYQELLKTLMLTERFSLRSLRVGSVRASRTRPTRRRTMWLMSLSAISNRKSGMMRLLRGPRLGTLTMMVLTPRGITSPTPPAAPPAKVPWPLRPRFLLRVLVITKSVLVRGSLRVPMQPRPSMPPFFPHRRQNARGPFTIQRTHLFQRLPE
jgi:hypothetical protein